jgi:hypothetical protein
MLQTVHPKEILTANVDIGMMCTNGVGRTDDTLNEQMRVKLQNLAVFKGAWFSLIGVDNKVNRLSTVFRNESPFLTRVCTTTTFSAKSTF